MITIQCPRCDEAVRLPVDQVPDDAYGQCPLCRETFPASEMLNHLPPLLHLMGPDGEPLQVCTESEVDLTAGFESPDSLIESQPETPGVEQGSVAAPFMDPSSVAGVVVGGAAAVGAAAIGLTGMGQAEESQVENQVGEIGDKLEGMFEQAEPGEYEYEAQDDVVVEEEQHEDNNLDNVSVEDETQGADETVIIDTWQETPTVQDFLPGDGLGESGLQAAGVEVGGSPELEVDGAAMQFMPDGGQDLVVVEDTMDDIATDFAEANAGEEMPAMKVAAPRKRFSDRKKRSPLKTILGVVAGPLIAIPLAGGILAAMDRLPDLGFWPADGSFNNGGKSSTTMVASDVPPSVDRSVNPSPRTAMGTSTELIAPGSDVANLVEEMNADDMESGQGMELPSSQENSSSSTTGLLSEGVISIPPPIGEADKPKTPKTNEPSGGGLADELMGFAPAPKVAAKPPVESVQQASSTETNGMTAPALGAEETIPEPRMDITEPETVSAAKTGSEPETKRPEPIRMPPINVKPADTTPGDAPAGGISMLPAVPEAGGQSSEAPFGDVVLDGPGETDSPELIAAVDGAKQAVLKLAQLNADNKATKKDIALAYAAVCKATTVRAPTTSTAVRELLELIGQSTVLSDFDGGTAKLWLNYSKRPSEGILIIGERGTNEQGQTLTLPTGEVLNVTLNRGGELPKSGRRVIALGEIVDGNNVQLIGAMGLD